MKGLKLADITLNYETQEVHWLTIFLDFPKV